MCSGSWLKKEQRSLVHLYLNLAVCKFVNTDSIARDRGQRKARHDRPTASVNEVRRPLAHKRYDENMWFCEVNGSCSFRKDISTLAAVGPRAAITSGSPESTCEV